MRQAFIILIFLLCGSIKGFAQHSQKSKTFDIYLILKEKDENFNISIQKYRPNTLITFFIEKSLPLEEFDYYLEEVFENRLSRVKRKKWQDINKQTIGFYHHPKDSLRTKLIRKENLKNLNSLTTEEIPVTQFSSIEKILKKADNIYMVVESWGEKEDVFKAYKVEMFKAQGSL